MTSNNAAERSDLPDPHDIFVFCAGVDDINDTGEAAEGLESVVENDRIGERQSEILTVLDDDEPSYPPTIAEDEETAARINVDEIEEEVPVDTDIGNYTSPHEKLIGTALGKRTLESLAFSIEEERQEFARPNDILKKLIEWTASQQYKLRGVCGKGLSSIRLNETSFAFLEEGHGLTIDRDSRLVHTGKAIQLIDLINFFENVAETSNKTVEKIGALLKISELSDAEFIEVLGARFGLTGLQASKKPASKRSATDRILDELVRREKARANSSNSSPADFMALRRSAVLEKSNLAEVINVAIKECMTVIDKRLLLFASSSGEVRTARPVNCILLAFKCEGLLPRKTIVKDRLVKRVCLDAHDFLCRMNVAVTSMYSGHNNSSVEVIIEMEVNLKQLRILSLYSACRNSVGSITATMEEIMNIQDASFEVIVEEGLLELMDEEEDYEIANFSELMGILVLSGLRPLNLSSEPVAMMWERSFYAVLRNISEFSSLFQDKQARQHLVDCLSLFYTMEPLMDDDDDKKTMLINIMLWAIFDEKRDTLIQASRTVRWQSSLRIAGQILWMVSCLFDYTRLSEVNYKFLPLILVHNFCISGKWAISSYNMSQWLASVVNVRSDRVANDNEIIVMLNKIGLSLLENEVESLLSNSEIINKVVVLTTSLDRATRELNIGEALIRRNRREAGAVLYHLVSMLFKQTPYYVFGEEELRNSSINSRLAREFKTKVDVGAINPDDYVDIIVELLQEADNGFSLMLDEIPADDEVQNVLLILNKQVHAVQNDSSTIPDDEVVGIATSEGLKQYQKQQEVLKKRINELASASSITGKTKDDYLPIGGIMTRLAQSYGTVVNQDICVIAGQQLSAKIGYSKDESLEIMGASLSLGDTQILGASSKIVEDRTTNLFRDTTVIHKFVILEGFTLDANCRFLIDTDRIRNALATIAAMKHAVGSDVRRAFKNARAKGETKRKICGAVASSEVIPFIFNRDDSTSAEDSVNNHNKEKGCTLSRWEALLIDIKFVVEGDLLMFSNFFVFRELNLPLCIILIPLDIVTITMISAACVADIGWNTLSWVHGSITQLQKMSSFYDYQGRGHKVVSHALNLFFGTATFASSAWLFALRTTLSSSLTLVIITADGLKEFLKSRYCKLVMPIRAVMISWATRLEEQHGVEVLKDEEEQSASMVMAAYTEETGVKERKTSKIVRTLSFILASIVFPPRIACRLISNAYLKTIRALIKVLDMLRSTRARINGKIGRMSARMQKLKERLNSNQAKGTANDGEINSPNEGVTIIEDVESNEVEASPTSDEINGSAEATTANNIGASVNESSTLNNQDVVDAETRGADNLQMIDGESLLAREAGSGPNRQEESSTELAGGDQSRMVSEATGSYSSSAIKETSVSLRIEKCGLMINEKEYDQGAVRLINRVCVGGTDQDLGGTVEVEECGLKSALSDYISGKILKMGYKKAMEALRKSEEEPIAALEKIPDDADSSNAEGLKSADLDILSYHYLQGQAGSSSKYILDGEDDCDHELGATIVGEICISHDDNRFDSVSQGSGKLTIVKFNTINCFFLYEKMLMTDSAETIKFSIHDSSSICIGGFSVKEIVSTGFSVNKRLTIGRASLLTNVKEGVEYIVSASHMVPYGRFLREDESYDGVDFLCCSWVFFDEAAGVRGSDDLIEEVESNFEGLKAIRSDFFLGDPSSDYLMFICNRGDYRGHSGGIIVDKYSRPVAICVSQLKIDNQLTIEDNKSIIIGCKLSGLDNTIMVMNAKRVLNCNECCSRGNRPSASDATINMVAELGRLRIDECVSNLINNSVRASDSTCTVQTGLLEKFCEVNKGKRFNTFLENHTKGNVLIKLMEIININKEVRIFDEPSEWIIKTIFNNLFTYDVTIFVVCSNMLTLSVCSLLTCIGVQFKRARNFHTIENLCINNSVNRSSELVLISGDDLLVDLAKIKNIRRNNFKDRCRIYVLCRTGRIDNGLDKVIIKSLLMMGKTVMIKAWELKAIMNVTTEYKMLDAPLMRYSQNSGHYRILSVRKVESQDLADDQTSNRNSRMIILTLATTKSAQEHQAARIVSEKELRKNDITVINFASLSVDAVCKGLIDSESLCISSWSSGDLSTKIYYNVLMDTSSDDLEVLMIQQGLNSRLADMNDYANEIVLSPVLESDHLVTDSGNCKIMEIKMTDTAKPNELFIYFFFNLIDNTTYNGKKIFKKTTDRGKVDMAELELVNNTDLFNLENKRLMTDDYIRKDKTRCKTISDKIKDTIEDLSVRKEKFKMMIMFKIREYIVTIRFRLKKTSRLMKRKISKIKQRALSMINLSCGLEEKQLEIFQESREELSDANSSASDCIVESASNQVSKSILLSSSSSSEEEVRSNKRRKTDKFIEKQYSRDNSSFIAKMRGKVNRMKEAARNMLCNMVNWVKGKLVSSSLIAQKWLGTAKNLGIKAAIFLKLIDRKKPDADPCAYYEPADNNKGLMCKIIKSLSVATAVVKLSPVTRKEELRGLIIGTFCADSITYEMLRSLNDTVADIYWKATSFPSAVVTIMELGCQLASKTIDIDCLGYGVTIGGEPVKTIMSGLMNVMREIILNVKSNTSVSVNSVIKTGLLVKEGSNLRSNLNVIQLLELSLKTFELVKRFLFKAKLPGVVNKLWKIITGRGFDSKPATGVLKTVPCYIETDSLCYYGGLSMLIIGIVKLAAMKTEEKMAMLGVITEKKHLADNINLYLNDRSEYADLIRVTCVSSFFLLRKEKWGLSRKLSLCAALTAAGDWFFSDDSYGGLGLSLAHVLSRAIAANSISSGLMAGLSAWWEDGSSKKIAMNALILLGSSERQKRSAEEELNRIKKCFNIGDLMNEQEKEREGNKALLDVRRDAVSALDECMLIVRGKRLSSRYSSKLADDSFISVRDRDLYMNVDATLMRRNTVELGDTVLTIKEMYINQCRYLGRLRELPLPREEFIDTESKQTSVLMVANGLWNGVLDDRMMMDWEAAGDSRSHILIAIAERNDSVIFLDVDEEMMTKYSNELARLVEKITSSLSGLLVRLNIHRINWMNVINISNEKSTPGILTRNRTDCKLTASYLPAHKDRVEAMREILLNNDVDEENEIINVFAKRRIEKKKQSGLTNREVVITRTIQANECDYKVAICDVFNVIDKLVKVTRTLTGISVGMNYFVEFANDDEFCKSIARVESAKRNMVVRRISLDHSSYDGSQRNWSIETAKIFRQQLVEGLFERKKKKKIKMFLRNCYESLKCRLMLTAQGDLFGLTGQQMSGHATTSVDNSIKAKAYCVAMTEKLKEITNWEIIQETIRVQGDDTKMEVICPVGSEDSEELVKEVISGEMSRLGQNVKKSKIEIFRGDEASNFLSHYTYDCICALRSGEGKNIAVLKLPGRNYFENINSLATTLKASTTKKYRKELGLLAAKSASFLTMYIGDPYMSCACCLTLTYCLNEIKLMRHQTNQIVVAKNQLAYLLSSSDDIETVSVDIASILKLHGVGRIKNSYIFESWIVGIREEEKNKAMSVVSLIKNVMTMMSKKGSSGLREPMRAMREIMNEVLNGGIRELSVSMLEEMIATGAEPIKLKIINSEVAYQPYLKLKKEVREGLIGELDTREVRYMIIEDIGKRHLCRTLASITSGNGKLVNDYEYETKLQYVNEAGFEVLSRVGRNVIVASKEEIICFFETPAEALLYGASMSNTMNIIMTTQEEINEVLFEKELNMRRGRMYDINEMSYEIFGQMFNNADQDRNNVIIRSGKTEINRRRIVDHYRGKMCSEFANYFCRI